MRSRASFDDENFLIRRDFLNVGDKTKTAARNGHDKLLILFKRTERFSKRENILRERRFFDERIRPNFVQKHVFADNLAAMFNQDKQRLKRLRRERNKLVGMPQAFLIRVHTKLVKFV